MANKKIENISIKGAKIHNLKDIDVSIPKNQITTVTGVSGSGKSSFAFDTLYKEGQFRYMESLSSYLRQFFNLGERPDIDYSEGLSPSIAIEQNKRIGNIRSTVGTMTELDDYVRLLFAKLGTIYCHSCGEKIQSQTTDQIIFDLKNNFHQQRIFLVEDIGYFKTKDDLLKFIRKNRKKVDNSDGYIRYLITYENDLLEYFYLEDPNIPNDKFSVRVYGIYDRVRLEEGNVSRVKEDIIKILGRKSKFGVYIDNKDSEHKDNNIYWYTDKNFCAKCDIFYPEFTTQHFSPNRQEGACTTCHGIGETLQVDLDKIIDTSSKYIEAVLPWRDSSMGQSILEKLAQKYGMIQDTPWKDLPDWFKKVVIEGDGELLRVGMGGKYISMYYKGIEDVLTQQFNKGVLTVDFQAMLDMRDCPDCNGAKLKKESLNVFLEINSGKKVQQYNIYDFQILDVDNLIKVLKKYYKQFDDKNTLAYRIINPLLDRSSTIQDLGLGHINSLRRIDTLSGGEIQRLRLAKQLGNKLTGIIYIIDEPTIGLDDKEIQKTIKAIKELKDIGNTIVVVEHNEEFIKQSDYIVEIGPDAGDFGGNVVFSGKFKDFMKSDTITAKYLRGDYNIQVDFNHKPTNKYLKIKKAAKYNLKNIDVNLKLGSFTIVTGSSGAGKTTLMYNILYRFLNEKQKFVQSYIRLNLLKKGYSWSDIISSPMLKSDEYEHYQNLALNEFYKDLGVDTIKGEEHINNIVYVDQTSIGKTPRSCPATFIGVFDDIRKLFAGTEDAKMIGFNSGHFSFNSSKGACPECDGYGEKKIELQFLPDTYVPCKLCNGKRYKSEILAIKWHGKTISEVLQMYVKDALEFFNEIGFIKDKLQLMVDIGLGYLKMGQPAHTMSGGESQRLKLVKHLLKSYRGHTLYFLDEPTVGLHPNDIGKLLNVLKKFLDKGDSIFMIEHDKVLLEFADEIIRLEDGALVKND